MVVDLWCTTPKSVLGFMTGLWSPGWESYMIFYSNLTIFYKASSVCWGTVSICVAILDQNTCMCDFRLVLYSSNVNISSFSRIKTPIMGFIDGFLLQSRNLIPSKSPLWRKTEYCCGCFAPKHMYVGMYDYITVLYSSNVNISSLSGFMNPGKGFISRWISTPTSPISTKQVPIFEGNWVFVWLCLA